MNNKYNTAIKDLKVGDWFQASWLNTIFYVTDIKDGYVCSTSPSFLNTAGHFHFHFYENNVEYLGESVPNFWYKIFKWTQFPHPVKLKKS